MNEFEVRVSANLIVPTLTSTSPISAMLPASGVSLGSWQSKRSTRRKKPSIRLIARPEGKCTSTSCVVTETRLPTSGHTPTASGRTICWPWLNVTVLVSSSANRSGPRMDEPRALRGSSMLRADRAKGINMASIGDVLIRGSFLSQCIRGAYGRRGRSIVPVLKRASTLPLAKESIRIAARLWTADLLKSFRRILVQS